MSQKIFEHIRFIYRPLKRVGDFVAAAVLLIVLSPVILIAAIAVRLTSEGPSLFWSSRTGQDGKMFMMPKLRTMTICSKLMSREVALGTDVKVTKLGRILRRTSIDELPQLWSVLKGDMSFVGPRPILEHDYALQERNSRPEIYSVKPGITGLAQVNGRNFVSPRNKARYDAFYANRVCFMLDFKIAWKTLGAVFRPQIIS